MKPEDLETVGRIVAAQSQGLDQDEIRQAVRIRFWEKPPSCLRAAWTMARNVRNDIWRTEKRHRHADLDGLRNIEAEHGVNDDPEAAKRRVANLIITRDAKAVRFLFWYQKQHNQTPTIRAQASLYRKRLRWLSRCKPREDLGRAHREQTHCKRGHKYTPDNITWTGPERRWRKCKQCARDGWHRHRRENMASGRTSRTRPSPEGDSTRCLSQQAPDTKSHYSERRLTWV